MITIVVDSRENGDFSKYETKTLEVGDFHIMKNGKVELIIERKIITDYVASIKDGRIKEQTFRLKECGVQVCFIIEGKMPKEGGSVNGISGDAIHNSITNKFIHSKIPSFFTKNVEETRDLLDRLATSIEKNVETVTTNYVGVCKQKKSTIENSFERILTTIPGISPKMAENVRIKSGTLPKLIESFKIYGPKFLVGVEGNGKKIGIRTAEKIYEFLEVS